MNSTAKTNILKPKNTLKDNKAGTKKESKPTAGTTLSKKAAPAQSSSKAEVLKTAEAKPQVDENQEFSKTTELRFEFIQAIQGQDYKKALEIAELIKKEEPNNQLIAHFQEFLDQNMKSLTEPEPEEAEEDGEEEEKDEEGESDSNEDENDDDEDDEDEDDEDEDEDENEGENDENKEVSEASTADQTQRTIS